MDVRTGVPIIHSILCTLAGVLFIAFLIGALAGPAWWSGSPGGLLLLLLGIALLFQIILGIWVGIDANRRGMNGFLWGALACFTCVVGLIVYLLSAQSMERTESPGIPPGRATDPATSCPECGSPVRTEFLSCPYCGTSLHRSCPQCANPIETGWRFCARCKADLGSETKPPVLGT